MITCPECGQQTADDAKFCDRCGQGLSSGFTQPATTSPSPLDPDTQLKGGRYRITALLSRTARENRYRGVRLQDNEPVQLREQPAPLRPAESALETELGSASPGEDPAGPRAKTAELRSEHSEKSTSTNGSIPPAPKVDSVNHAVIGEDRHDIDRVNSEAMQDNDSGTAEAGRDANAAGVHVLTEAIEETTSRLDPPATEAPDGDPSSPAHTGIACERQSYENKEAQLASEHDDLGDVFGRVLALSMTLNHPAFQRAIDGFADRGRVYLAYSDEELRPLSSRAGSLRMNEGEALQLAIQVCQAVSFVHRRGLRVNDICPDSVAYAADGRIKMTGLDYLSNDNELQSEPIFNDGYTAPEIYRGKKAGKRADIFSIAALLYTCVTGERLDSETWREEAGPIRFYPPHVVTPALEQTLRQALQFDPAARWPNVDALKAEFVKLAATVRVRADGLTDVGRVREHNEDSVLAFACKRDSLIDPEQKFLYVVADGMGGAEAGEVASAIAVETIRNYVERKMMDSGAANVSAILQAALEEANSRIIEYQSGHPETRSMGSTAVAALINPPNAGIAWVGDSRAYVCDGYGLRQLSKDHSLVQRLIEIGQISAEEARHHEHKNVITRSLGARPTGPAGAESVSLRLKRGDRLLLCSDGLTTHVEDPQIEEILRRHSDPAAAGMELVVAANAAGGSDNISVVVVIAE